MKSMGLGLTGLGVFIAIIALFLMPSTVSTEDMTTIYGARVGTGIFNETYNLSRAQIRELVFHGGGFVFLAGILLFVGGTVEELLRGAGLRLAEPKGGEEALSAVPAATADSTPTTTPVYNFEAAEAAAIKNKEMVAWAFGAIILMVAGVFLIAQLYGPAAH